MSDEQNIEEQPTDNSPQSREENSKSLTDSQSQTIHPKLENMEVHKHPQHVTHKKKWGEYLLEFFMLFLAVFLGFVAENIRETIVEKEKGKQYIESFYHDLNTDTATFAKIIENDNVKLDALKNLFQCYDTIKKNWKSTSCLLPIAKNSRTNLSVSFSDGTLNQLKNAGGFRLLPREDKDSIILYDNQVRDYQDYHYTYFQESQNLVRSTFSMLLDFEANRYLSKAIAGSDSSIVELPLLLSYDKPLLNKYFNELLRYKNAIAGQKRILLQLQTKAAGLIAYFKNKYYLENE